MVEECEHVPELRLLLCCARRALDPHQAAQIKELLGQRIDWQLLLPLTDSHGLSPLLYWHLSQSFSRFLPDAIAGTLRDRFQDNARRTLQLTGELVQTVKLLGRHNIQVVPFKGPTLAETLYGNVALRSFTDLDFLVRPGDLHAAIQVLIAGGYQSGFKLTSAQQAAWLRSYYEYSLLSPAGSLIELHWRIVPRHFSLSFGSEQCWGNLTSVRIGGTDVPALSPEDLLLMLCVHGAKHEWSRLLWLCDVSELIRSSANLDWERVLGTARGVGAERMLLLGLSLSNSALGTAIPESVQRKIAQDTTTDVLRQQVYRRWTISSAPSELRSQLFLLRVRERLRDRMRYMFYFILTPTREEWSLVTLPSVLFPLYSGLRVLRGMLKVCGLTGHWVRRKLRGIARRRETSSKNPDCPITPANSQN